MDFPMLATMASMIQHLEGSHIDPLRISLKEEHAHFCNMEAEPDGKAWYNDIKIYLERREYPEGITSGQKKTIRRMANSFFLNNEFGVPESIITDNVANLNSHLMKDICEQFKITHRNLTAYQPQMNGAVEAANKNIKRILRKRTDSYKVSGSDAVIPAEGEIPSLRIIQEAELDNAEWVRARYEKLALIDKKMMAAICHG
ncbi:uncharacterized protein LOC132630882 [Lycium barbarum]|uniref:uncharacterized protein LOC132630882 n=1 Tax=Lycium barbarum TaxID=112863 RepID=UPI00293F024D|nr:uncharacterized protein LOC132630882 [Lycium barbarum]